MDKTLTRLVTGGQRTGDGILERFDDCGLAWKIILIFGGGGFDIIKSEICGEDRSCIIYYIQILTTAIGTDNDGEGETETDDLFVIVGGEGANSPDGELGKRCHDSSESEAG